MMSQSFRKHSPVIARITGGLIIGLSVVASTSLYTGMALADWSSEKLYRGYNQSFGAFPPIDIDQRLSVSVETTNRAANQSTKDPTQVESVTHSAKSIQPTAKPSPVNQASGLPQHNYTQQRNPQQRYAQQGYQQPAYGVNNQRRNYNPQQNQRRNPSSSFNGPWNNSFGNNRSGVNGSGFNGPWNNNQTNFTGPWNSNGSGFSMPWGNNGSGFNPMGNSMGNNKGNGGSWSW